LLESRHQTNLLKYSNQLLRSLTTLMKSDEQDFTLTYRRYSARGFYHCQHLASSSSF